MNRTEAAELAELERALVAELEKKVAGLAAALAAAEEERAAEFRAYNPADSSAKALASIEKASARRDAVKLQHDEAVAALESHRAELREREFALLAIDARAAVAVAGMTGWRNAHVDEIARVSSLFREALALVRALAAAPIEPFAGEAYARAVDLAKRTGIAPPEPVTALAVARELKFLQPTHEAFVMTEYERGAVDRLWSELLTRVEPDVARRECFTYDELSLRIDRAIHVESPDLGDAHRGGRASRYTRPEHAALSDRAQRWARDEQEAMRHDPLRHEPDRLRAFRELPTHEKIALLPQLFDRSRMVRLLSAKERARLLAAGLPVSFIPADLRDEKPAELRAREE